MLAEMNPRALNWSAKVSHERAASFRLDGPPPGRTMAPPGCPWPPGGERGTANWPPPSARLIARKV